MGEGKKEVLVNTIRDDKPAFFSLSLREKQNMMVFLSSLSSLAPGELHLPVVQCKPHTS